MCLKNLAYTTFFDLYPFPLYAAFGTWKSENKCSNQVLVTIQKSGVLRGRDCLFGPRRLGPPFLGAYHTDFEVTKL